jgi:hypothetical protein
MTTISIEALSNGCWATHDAWERAKAAGTVRDEYEPALPGYRRQIMTRFGPVERVPQSNDDGEGDCG